MSLLIRLAGEEDFLYFEEDARGQERVVFQGFDPALQTVFCYSSVEILKENELKESFFALPEHLPNLAMQCIEEEEYIKKVSRIKNAITSSKSLEKVVLSRPLDIPYQRIHLAETFYSLCKDYPNAYVYLWQSAGKVWLGASPELLGKYDPRSSLFYTMSLAGTLPIDQPWSEKEILEQQKVTEYIRERLAPLSSQVWVNDQYNYFSGAIKHLRNDIVAEISDKNLLPIVSRLHPTPAVCGFPKEEARKLIYETEEYDREYYSGYLQFEVRDLSYFIVNLRCMQIFRNAVRLYIGGGINSLSDPRKEWNETVLKSGTILGSLI